MYFKALDNSVHCIDSEDHVHLLPIGSVQITEAEADQLRLPPPSAPTLKDYDIAIERNLDAEAEAAGYYDPLGRIPNIDRACSYAGHTNPYQAESQSFVAWRAEVWAYVYQVKSEVEAGTREQPTIDALLAELPARIVPE